MNLANIPIGLTSTNGFSGRVGGVRAIQNFVFCKRQLFFFIVSPVFLGTNYFLILKKKKKKQPAHLCENEFSTVFIIPHESGFAFICGCLITKTRSLIKIGLVMCISFKENHRNSICDSLPS